jgi:hypothetical protein
MRLHSPLLALAAVAALAGCDIPSAPDSVVYGVLSATIYKSDPATGQPDALFGAANAVYLENAIPVIDDTNSGVVITQPVIDGVVGQLKTNLEARGYTVTLRNPGDPTPPAGSLRMGAYSLFGSVNMYYSSYWCSWYYYYYCYPTTSYAGSYDYGVLLIEAGTELYTPGNPPPAPPAGGGPPPPSQQGKLIWTNASYGVFAGSSTITTGSPGYQKTLASIDQAFAQSPYFRSAP